MRKSGCRFFAQIPLQIISAATLRASTRLAVAIRFVDECVTHVKVSDATFADAKEVFSPGEIVEMTLLTGFYMMIARFLATLAIDLDAAPVDWSQSDCVNERADVSRCSRGPPHKFG